MDILRENKQRIKNIEFGLVLFGFCTSLLVGSRTHYVNLVKNHLYEYPNEWFPSVSSVIGDFYPARNIIQLCMALTSTPRFINIYIRYLDNPDDKKVVIFDILRTLSIGGWVYVTSCDNATLHSISMAMYLISQVSFMYLSKVSFVQKIAQRTYITNIGIMMYYLYSHNMLRVSGAYSYYAVFEWMLVPLDIAFDHMPESINISYVFSFIAQEWSSSLFWVNVTSLPAMLWYFPLWNMGLSGYEVVLLSYFSPVLIPMLWKNGMSHKTQLMIKMTSGLSLMAFLTPCPKVRLLLVSLSTAASTIEIFRENAPQRIIHGLLTFTTVKFVNYSLHPLWPMIKKDSSTNFIILMTFLGCSCVFSYVNHRKDGLTLKTEVRLTNTVNYRTCFLSMSVGIAMWILHTIFTDFQGVISRLSYEDHSIPYELLTSLFLIYTTSMKLQWTSGFTESTKYYIILILSMILPVKFLILMSGNMILQQSMLALTQIPIVLSDTRLVLLMCGTYVGLLLADVWTVAYAFVPFGNLFRERSDWIIYIVLGLLAISNGKMADRFVRVTTFSKPLLYVLLFTTTLSGFMQMNVMDNREQLMKHKDKKIMTVGIWTVHFGLDSDQYFSHDRMNRLITKLDLDVVGLLESDTLRPIGGNRNMVKYMAYKMNMYHEYGPTSRDHTWGCSLLSKYPIIKSEYHLLPSPVGELACAINATLMTPGGNVDILISHNGQEEDELDRTLQTIKLAEISKASRNPFVFAGYLVTKPGKGNLIYDIITERGNLTDIYHNDKRRWCQYIMYRDILALGYARVSHGDITDTELQTAKFWVGGNTTRIHLNERNMYSTDLIKDIGESWNGHRYHIYKSPIYGSELTKSSN